MRLLPLRIASPWSRGFVWTFPFSFNRWHLNVIGAEKKEQQGNQTQLQVLPEPKRGMIFVKCVWPHPQDNANHVHVHTLLVQKNIYRNYIKNYINERKKTIWISSQTVFLLPVIYFCWNAKQWFQHRLCCISKIMKQLKKTIFPCWCVQSWTFLLEQRFLGPLLA